VILARLRGDAEIGAQERTDQLGHEFLAGIAGIAEPLRAEIHG